MATKEDSLEVNARVRKYRANLRNRQCRRLDVCIGITVIENIRRIAKYKKQQTWAVIQQALETYVSAYVQKNHLPVRRPEPGSYIKRVR